jgi:crossover junction endodeoxyribonuclease RuvC
MTVRAPVRILGLDPALRHAGWGVIESQGSALRYVACGMIQPPTALDLAQRFAVLHESLQQVIATYRPDVVAIEQTFVNMNPQSTLSLGMARGVMMAAAALCGLAVHDYAATVVKKSLVGNGRGQKNQVQAMVQILLPSAVIPSDDAADALAVAICHAHHAPIVSYCATGVVR